MARPDIGALGRPPGLNIASMEGRAMARPDSRRERRAVGRNLASMEGRAMARPDWQELGAKEPTLYGLQWRAEQWLGQTSQPRRGPPRPLRFNGGPSNGSARRRESGADYALDRFASMEGRAMARPDPPTGRGRRWCMAGFNGGPSNGSARPPWLEASLSMSSALQWRAEQWLGQTKSVKKGARSGTTASMEGRAMARPDCCPPGRPRRGGRASMEGRAMARPDCCASFALAPTNQCFNGGPSNGSARHSALVTLQGKPQRFNGGPSNGSARRLAIDFDVEGGAIASMEGRAMARPDLRLALLPSWSAIPLQWRAEQWLGQTPAPACWPSAR